MAFYPRQHDIWICESSGLSEKASKIEQLVEAKEVSGLKQKKNGGIKGGGRLLKARPNSNIWEIGAD